jgi:AraC-like DNA-binding protein
MTAVKARSRGDQWRSDILTPYRELLPKVAPSADPLDDPTVWRSIVNRLGLNPMHCPYSIRDIAAENGISPERAYFRFVAHFHTAPWEWVQ